MLTNQPVLQKTEKGGGIKNATQGLPSGPAVKSPSSDTGDAGSIPGRGTESHMPQDN